MSVYEYLERAQTEIRQLRSALAVTGADFIAATRERDAALDVLGRVGGVLFMHSHADGCGVATGRGTQRCSCWRAGIYAALEPTS